jgi:Flp pilus assembly protein TadG
VITGAGANPPEHQVFPADRRRLPLPALRRAGGRSLPAGAWGQEGLMAAELAVLLPLIVFFLLLIAGVGRYSHARQLVDDASAAAARAASLASSPAQAVADARQIAATTVREGDLTCRHLSVEVDVSAFGPGGQVAVTVGCTADLSTVVMAGLPRTVALSSRSTSALETYRDFSS